MVHFAVGQRHPMRKMDNFTTRKVAVDSNAPKGGDASWAYFLPFAVMQLLTVKPSFEKFPKKDKNLLRYFFRLLQ